MVKVALNQKLKSFFIQVLATLLMTNFLASCAGIPGGRVKLESYPDVVKEDMKELSLAYKLEKSDRKHFNIYESILDEPSKVARNINSSIDAKLIKTGLSQKESGASCMVKISSSSPNQLDGFCGLYYPIPFLTLFILPYYCPNAYEAKATLTSTKDNKVLKEYYLKDKVHEVWSLIWLLNPWSWDEMTPETAKGMVESNISEALVRSILNDAKTFPECIKKK